MTCVGKNIPRIDGQAKVTGEALYVDDIAIEGMWYGAVVRSTIPRGSVKEIAFDPSFDWSSVVVADQNDIPGKNHVAMITTDVPLLVFDNIMHTGEAILLIAAPTKELATQARSKIKIEYDELKAVFTIEDSKSAKIKIRGEDNIMSQYSMNKGDIKKGFADADLIIEGTYTTPHQEHMYLETNGVIAIPEKNGGMSIEASIQCPFYIAKALAQIMDLPLEKISVRQAVVGGAFGGKEDYPSILAGYCAVLAKKSNHPVKIIYDRVEDTLVTTKRHPSIVKHKTGVKRDGTLTAMEILVEMDAGAYSTMTPVVLSRGMIHSAGPYRCDNVKANAYAYTTNTPPNGAFRGFGVPQTTFAIEVHMDAIAKAINLSPIDIRRKNYLCVGDTTATSQLLRESVAAKAVFDAAVKSSDFEKKFSKYASSKEKQKRRGIGMALFMHGAGFTGAGETRIKAKAGLRLEENGNVTILIASTEMGQGSHTVLSQIVADALNMDINRIKVATPDTAKVPDSGPTVASRTTMVVGGVLVKCAEKLKKNLPKTSFLVASKNCPDARRPANEQPERTRGVREDCEFAGNNADGRFLEATTIIEEYELPPHIVWDEKEHKGDAYPAYAWGADVAEVEIDLDTFEINVIKMWLATDCGKVVNPTLACGQIEGGTLQSLGYAIMENEIFDRGQAKTNRFQTYIIPTAVDTPEVETILVEELFSFGPMGVKGLGELPMDGGAPAIANAISNALGIEIKDIPVTPERLFKLWVNNKHTPSPL